MTNYLPEDLPSDPSSAGASDPSNTRSDSRAWAVAAHLVPFVSLAIIGPLFVWLIKRDEDDFVEHHAREALNFQLSLLIYGIVSAILILVYIVVNCS